MPTEGRDLRAEPTEAQRIVSGWLASAFGEKWINTQGFIAERRITLEGRIAAALAQAREAGRRERDAECLGVSTVAGPAHCAGCRR